MKKSALLFGAFSFALTAGVGCDDDHDAELAWELEQCIEECEAGNYDYEFDDGQDEDEEGDGEAEADDANADNNNEDNNNEDNKNYPHNNA